MSSRLARTGWKADWQAAMLVTPWQCTRENYIGRKVAVFTNLSDSAKALLFFVLALGLTVTAALLYPILGRITLYIHMYTPTLAVLIVMLVVTRDGYSKAGWSALGLHRLGLRWWTLALLGPLALMSAIYCITWSSNVADFTLPADFTWAAFASGLASNLGVSTALGLGEELGFRAYLLPRLAQFGMRRAMILSGLMHAIWHFPLMLLTPVYPVLGSWLILGPVILLTLTSAGVFYSYLQLSGRSVWPATLAHGAVNTAFDFFRVFTITATPLALEYMAGETGVLTLVATGLSAGAILYHVRQRRGAQAVHLPSGA
jgi:membrane protease YdiL (CAAX protease family)